MPRYFLIEGHHEVHRLTEIDGKAHVTTAEGTFKMREKVHSNTFLAAPGHIPIPHVYETIPVDFEAILRTIPESPLHEPSFYDLSPLLTKREISQMAPRYHLLCRDEAQGPDAPKAGLVARICTDDVIKVLCYMQALGGPDEFALYDASVKRWAYANFEGSSAELGLHVLLLSVKRGRGDEFMAEWRKRDLSEPDLASLLAHMKGSALAALHKAEIGGLLAKLNIPRP